MANSSKTEKCHFYSEWPCIQLTVTFLLGRGVGEWTLRRTGVLYFAVEAEMYLWTFAEFLLFQHILVMPSWVNAT